jgi:hypothetical protein
MRRKLNDSATGCYCETVVKSCKPPGDFGIGLVECVVVLQQTVFRGRALTVGCGGASWDSGRIAEHPFTG